MSISILIVDDHALVREGIRAFLQTQTDLSVVGEAADGERALELAQALHPDVVLLDLVLPGGGPTLARELSALQPAPRLVVLTSFEDDARAADMLEAGALSFVLKDLAPSELAQVIRRAAADEPVLHPRIAARLVRRLRGGAAPADAALSQREREVLSLIAQGLSNLDIAQRLNIGEKTVKTHVSNLLAKLGVSDRTQAAIYAWRHRLVSA